MNKIEVGEIYVASKQRIDKSGENKWELLAATNADGKDPITMWVAPGHIPSGVQESSRFKVVAITKYTQKKKKNEFNGKTEWIPDNSIEVVVEPVSDSFDSIESPVNSETPFTDMSNSPFASANPFANANPFAQASDDDGELPF